MTDQEKQELSEKIATLAEQAGITSALLWEAAETCPQGHDSYGEAVGQVCMVCVFRATPRIKEEYIMHQFLEGHPDAHPEWRFGRQAKDMTNPAVLLPVVEAWIYQAMRQRDEYIEWQSLIGQWRAEFSTLTAYGWVEFEGTDPNRTVAEARAFALILDAEKGESS